RRVGGRRLRGLGGDIRDDRGGIIGEAGGGRGKAAGRGKACGARHGVIEIVDDGLRTRGQHRASGGQRGRIRQRRRRQSGRAVEQVAAHGDIGGAAAGDQIVEAE